MPLSPRHQKHYDKLGNIQRQIEEAWLVKNAFEADDKMTALLSNAMEYGFHAGVAAFDKLESTADDIVTGKSDSHEHDGYKDRMTNHEDRLSEIEAKLKKVW
jgi:hypothetical protein